MVDFSAWLSSHGPQPSRFVASDGAAEPLTSPQAIDEDGISLTVPGTAIAAMFAPDGCDVLISDGSGGSVLVRNGSTAIFPVGELRGAEIGVAAVESESGDLYFAFFCLPDL